MKVDSVPAAPPTYFGDGALWSKITKSLIYVDTDGKKVYSFDPATQTSKCMEFDQCVGFAVPTSFGKRDKELLFVGLENKIVEVNLTDGQIRRTVLTVPMEYYQKGMRFSCAKSSPDGVLYAGYMHPDWVSGYRGYLFQIVQVISHGPHCDSDEGEAKFVVRDVMTKDAEGVHFPNGMAWHGANTLYVVDSAMGRIYQLTFEQPAMKGDKKKQQQQQLLQSASTAADPCAKRLVQKNTIYTLQQTSIDFGYILSGMTIDHKGKLWVALCGAGLIMRIDPLTGQEMFKLHMEATRPTSVTFGGDDFGEMFVTFQNEQEETASSRPRAAPAPLATAHMDGVRGLESCSVIRMDLQTVADEIRPMEAASLFQICCCGLAV